MALSYEFDLIEKGKSGQFDFEERDERILVPKCSLPFGIPPILPNVRDQLENLLNHPENLPIHDLNRVQKLVSRVPNPNSIMKCPLMPLQTELRAERDSATGFVKGFKESVIQDTGQTAKNSLSLQRQPGSFGESIMGNVSNFPFWPGGMDKTSNNAIEIGREITDFSSVKSKTNDLDFSHGLLTTPPGFKSGIMVDESSGSNFDFDLSEVLAEHAIEIKNVNFLKSNKELSLNKHSFNKMLPSNNEDPEEVEQLLKKTEIPILEISHLRNTEQDFKGFNWAVKVNIIQPVEDFKNQIPNMAREWPFELDIFQKQAILKLETHDSVFVAAHTSAGKTVVAEYAIALALKHGTKVIYTSPVKALSNQKFRDFKMTFGDVGLLTGDIQINEKASCLIMTTEILRSMLYNGAETVRDLEWVIFDEVHYINDPERGVVWEEVLIMLPEQVKLVLLSATVSNTMELADWVGRTKKKKIYVISTLKRPIPLEHYLYTGSVGKTQDEKFLIIDSSSNFLDRNYALVKEIKDERAKKNQSNFGPKGTRHNVSANQEKNIYRGLIGHLKKNEKLPVICFTLSRKRCNFNAELLSSLDLTTAREKGAIHKFFRKSIETLKPIDQNLPQVRYMEGYLKQGFGIHHSGILPILKEIVEMLFQEGLIKVLFATETFAIGVNMPARTVVFDSIRKHDGQAFRDLISSEYIQMAGRAGRRGLDDTGTVIVLVKGDMPPICDLKIMMLGKPPIMSSKFRVTYGMVLNLLRARQLRIEEILKRSFREAGSERNRSDNEAELKLLTEKMANLGQINCEMCKDLENYCRALTSLETLRKAFIAQIFTSGLSVKLMTLGRVILVNTDSYKNVIGAVLNCNHNKSFVTALLLCRKVKLVQGKNDSTNSVISPWSLSLHNPDKSGDYCIVDVHAERIIKVSSLVVNLSKKKAQKLRHGELDQLALALLVDLQTLAEEHKEGVPWCAVGGLEIVELQRELNTVEKIFESFKCIRCHDFKHHFKTMCGNITIQDEMSQAKRLLSDENLQLLPNYQSCVQVLQELEYVDKNRILSMKGRVACEFSNNEILLTEILSLNLLADKTAAEIAALLSCFVFQMKTDEKLDLTKNLEEGCEEILKTSKMIENIQKTCGLHDDPDFRIEEQLRFGLTTVVHEWAKGVPFSEIAEMTTVDEGIIVRNIQRLTEVMKDIRNAAHIFGDDSLRAKIDESSQAIKRDIVFAASLYTQ